MEEHNNRVLPKTNSQPYLPVPDRHGLRNYASLIIQRLYIDLNIKVYTFIIIPGKNQAWAQYQEQADMGGSTQYQYPTGTY
jgi:hypothetical protein